MRKLDWLLAGVIAAFLVAVLVEEVSSLSFAGARVGDQQVRAGEVVMQRIVSRLPRAPLLTQTPQ